MEPSVSGIHAVFEDVLCPYNNALRVNATSARNQRLVSESHGTTYRERSLDVQLKMDVLERWEDATVVWIRLGVLPTEGGRLRERRSCCGMESSGVLETYQATCSRALPLYEPRGRLCRQALFRTAFMGDMECWLAIWCRQRFRQCNKMAKDTAPRHGRRDLSRVRLKA
jgi:hypothetical protein